MQMHTLSRRLAAAGAVLQMSLALAQGGSPAPAPPASPWVVSADGALVVDTRSHLAWERCVVGMQWDGRGCRGRARLLTFSEAKALASERWKAEGVRWRLPRVPELRRLVQRGGAQQGVDPQLFPDAPGGLHWSGTSSVNAGAVNPYAYDNVMRGGRGGDTLRVRSAWAVDMDSAQGHGDVPHASALVVRLVRPAPRGR
ncbi:DUF1566 domain-containing protein [Comamonas sp. NLF-1-9]|uniref:Lcl C-terminal domain-containing protein n=1 Tax=Comamonas sp. NLF-1-9 TaxID=2853163 RepID=UPI001C45A3C7|nr:DUF1566 domain-containing protein [Comamonas sp. NLF-1-9]QXL84705.1 DUF1566 domain-containing protein [Comamonas sp. NLF-1-9]